MPLVNFVQADGLPLRHPLEVATTGRVRLSAFMRRHGLDTGRREPIVVSVTRASRLRRVEIGAFVDMVSKPDAHQEVMRRDWSKTTLGPRDVVTITHLPLGGGAGGGAGRKVGFAAALAGILLGVLAPVAIPALAPLFGVSAGTIGYAALQLAYTGVVIGLSYLASRATQPKANKESETRPLYGVTGGGNVPRAGDRISVIYGRVWTQPALSQPDFVLNEGDDQYLFKRLTIGCGQYSLKAVRIGSQEIWRDGNYLNGIGENVTIELINPGGASTIVPDITASADVTGIELPRHNTASPPWTGWYRVSPVGVPVTELQVNWTAPGGVWISGVKETRDEGKTFATPIHPQFQYALCNAEGQPVSDPVLFSGTLSALTLNQQQPLRRTTVQSVTSGEYVVRAANFADAIPNNRNGANTVYWDALVGRRPSQIVRPGITELCIKVKAGPGLAINNFANVECEVARILPCYRGGTFVSLESRKALDAFVDAAIDPNYGAGIPPNAVDVAKVESYLASLSTFDTFDGQINGPISVWEAWSVILGPMRSEPVQVGQVLSFVRDENQTLRKHHFTRRQIVKDSSAAEISLDRGQGVASIRSEYNIGGDPRRRGEVTAQYGPTPLAPSLVSFEGVVAHAHAEHLARWTAATAFYRRETRRIQVELQHRSVRPGDRIGIDLWFLSDGISSGVVSQVAGSPLSLIVDSDLVWPGTAPETPYAYLIDRRGREFGPISVFLDPPTRTVSLHEPHVLAAQVASGLSLADVLQPNDGGALTHMRIGALAEITEDYIVRSVRPVDALRADIEAVNDAEEVWSALGESSTSPPASGAVPDLVPPIPQIGWVTAAVHYVNGAPMVRFAAERARGAVRWDFQLQRGAGAAWALVQSSSASSGEVAIDHQDGVQHKIRAQAYGTFGVPGQWVESAAFLSSPAIMASNVVDTIDAKVATAEAAAATLFSQANARTDALFRSVETALSADPVARAASDARITIAESVEQLADAVLDLQLRHRRLSDRLTDAGVELDGPNGVARIFGVAKIESETATRFNQVSIELDALRGEIELIAETVVNGDFSGLVASISAATVRISALEASIVSTVTQAQRTADLARLSTVETDLDAAESAIALRATQASVDTLATTLTTATQDLDAARGEIITAVQTATGAGLTANELADATLAGLIGILQRLDGMVEATSRASSSLQAYTDQLTGDAVARAETLVAAARGDAAAAVLAESVARSSAIAAEAATRTSAIATVTGQINAVDARVTNESVARANGDAAEAAARQAAIATLTNSVNTVDGRVTTESAARAAGDTAEANARQAAVATLTNSVNTVDARVTTESAARVNGDNALAASQSTLQAQLQGQINVRATISDLNVVQAQVTANNGAIAAVAARTTQVESSLGPLNSLARWQIIAGVDANGSFSRTLLQNSAGQNMAALDIVAHSTQGDWISLLAAAIRSDIDPSTGLPFWEFRRAGGAQIILRGSQSKIEMWD